MRSMKTNRFGGKSLMAMDIGRMSVLRQGILLPGEVFKPHVQGNVRLSPLKTQTSVYLHARIDCFAAPLRWFWSDFPQYLREGPSTAVTVPTMTGASWTANRVDTTNLGLGFLTHDFFKPYAQMPIAVWNEHFRWKEDARVSVDDPPIVTGKHD